jgi:hypothetical protein
LKIAIAYAAGIQLNIFSEEEPDHGHCCSGHQNKRDYAQNVGKP